MENDVRMPIEVSREGEKITKVCVEDVYKLVNRVIEAMDKAYNDSVDVIEFLKKDYYPANDPEHYYNGYLIKGTGISQPCNGDEFNEELGNDIAFMKAKLNANIKKHNFLCRVYNNFIKATDVLDEDIDRIDNYIKQDLNNLRNYNPQYLINLEDKLGIV